MLLKYGKTVPYIPNPKRPRLQVSAADKELGSQNPPQAVPYHCKPWVDGQTLGWTLFYGYFTPVTIIGQADGSLKIDNLEKLMGETQQKHIVAQFAHDHFGIGSGLTLRTPPGFVSLIMPAANAPTGLRAITGLVETDWYPRQLFLVFAVPEPGQSIKLAYETPLARVVVIPRQEEAKAEPLNSQELADLDVKWKAYLAEEQTTSSQWKDSKGHSFTHLYKQHAKKQVRN